MTQQTFTVDLGLTIIDNSAGGGSVTGGNGAVNITADDSANTATWTFDPTGNLTLPSNTASINYANGTPYGGGGGGANTGNITFSGTAIEIAPGASETNINISPTPEGWAFVQLPNNATANTANTRVVNAAGNVTIETGDFSTGGSSVSTWVFDITGNLAIPGTIVADSTVRIDNRESGNTADIQLYSADDILLQGRDRTLGDDIEGGDINIYAGDGSPDDAGGGTGTGGDIQIIGGVGGAADVSSGGNGGSVRLDAGNGGDGSATAAAGSGASAYLSAGNGGIDNGGGGNNGGDVVITAGDTSDIAQDRGSVILNAGGGGDASSLGGYVQVNIPSVGTNPGGQWTFTGSGTTLETPTNAEIFGPNFGNLTVGSAGNTIITSADYGFTTYNWVFDNAGGIVAPTLTVTRGDRTGTLTGSTLRIGNGSQEAILTTPNGVEGSDSQRLVINPGAGDGFGEGGDIYLYSGRGGSSGGSGGDIKIRGGLGPADGAGGYIDIVGGEAAGNGVGGYVDILGGQSANSTGGPVRIYGGQGISGAEANITGGVGTAGPGGGVNITGGTSSNGVAEYGNVTITAGASTWTFNNAGVLTLPGEGVVRSINDVVTIESYDTANAVGLGFYVGTNGGLYFKQGANPNWLTINPNASNAEISSRSDLTLTSGTGTGGAAGNNISITAGAADQSDYYTTPGGNVNITGGLGAFNDGGGGGPGGSVNLTAGASSDPAGRYGNITVNTGGANTWTFDYTGNLTAPGAISATGNISSGNSTVTGNATITYTPSATVGTGILINAANTIGGTGYADFLRATNTSGGATNPSKTIRLNSTGGLEVINNAYSATILSLTDAGGFSVPGPISVSGKQAVNGPAFRAYVSVGQTISSGSQQKVTFGGETFDTNGNFASSRFTPTVEGYYQFNATVRISGGASTGECMLVLYKNGAEYARGNNESGTEQGASFYSMQVSDIAYANGTGDYFEIYIQQSSGSNRDTTAGAPISYFSGCMIRGA